MVQSHQTGSRRWAKSLLASAITPSLFAAINLGISQSEAASRSKEDTKKRSSKAETSERRSEKFHGLGDRAKPVVTRVEIGQIVKVTVNKLNARSSPNTSSNANILGTLNRGSEVQTLAPADSQDMVRVKLLSSDTYPADKTDEFYVNAKALFPTSLSSDQSNAKKYFVIQNIATERSRVYELCTSSPGCAHRLVFETEMVVGKTTPNKKDNSDGNFLTRVGWYQLNHWEKFYQDKESHYPAWYSPSFGSKAFPPPPNANDGNWLKLPGIATLFAGSPDKYLPDPKANVGRGAFGWYAGMLTPSYSKGEKINDQYLHGTFGWGMEGSRFIDRAREWLANFGSADARSKGCTRHENQAIAYLNSILTPGTDVIRIYAKEGYRDPARASYQNQQAPKPWNWVLTTETGGNSGLLSSDREAVNERIRKGVLSEENFIEYGTYQIDQYPNALTFVSDPAPGDIRKAKSGNTYEVPAQNMKGVFLVDEGRLVNYRHPNHENVKKGGLGQGTRAETNEDAYIEPGQDVPKFATSDSSSGVCLPLGGNNQDSNSILEGNRFNRCLENKKR